MKLIGYYNYTVIATYAGLLAAVYGIAAAFGGEAAVATYCLFFCGVVDTFDGKIARTRKRSEREKLFGIEIDSLSDLVSFGVLPVAIGMAIGCRGWLSIAVSCAYILCALIRLAYFNVDEMCRQQETTGRREIYEGLPVTSAALIFPLLFALRGFMPKHFAAVYCAILALVAAAFVLKFRIKKPGRIGLIIFFIIGLIELILILALR